MLNTYPPAIAELKESGELGRRCRCRTAPYLNNIIEQDHRFIKKRITASLGFRSAEGACRTIAGYEAMHAIRKGQARWVTKGDAIAEPCGKARAHRQGLRSMRELPARRMESANFSDRFEREVHAVAALNHPNICHVYDVGPNYLVMELVEGPTLAERIKEGAMSLEQALPVARQIAEALEAAHEKGSSIGT